MPKLPQYVLASNGRYDNDSLGRNDECLAHDGTSPFQRCSVNIAEGGEARACPGHNAPDHVIDKALMLFLTLSDRLYPGLGAKGILISLQHFYGEYRSLPKVILQVLKKRTFDHCERKRSHKCRQFLAKAAFHTYESGENNARKSAPEMRRSQVPGNQSSRVSD